MEGCSIVFMGKHVCMLSVFVVCYVCSCVWGGAIEFMCEHVYILSVFVCACVCVCYVCLLCYVCLCV